MTVLTGVFDDTANFAGGLVGHVTNTDELRAAGGLASDANAFDIARALVRQSGPDAVGRLRGAYALAVWDEAEHRGVLATDHLGAGGLFYRVEEGRVSFATEIRDLLELLPHTPAPDEDALIRWLAYDVPAPGQTLYSGIRRLRPGELIELGPTSFRVRRYWLPRYTEPARLDDWTELVRDAAAAAVARRRGAGAPVGVLLSGGLDSASVAAFAHERSPGDVHGFSAVFPEHPEMDESRLIADVAGALQLPLTLLEVRGGSMLAASLDYLATWRLPSASPNLFFMGPLARAAADDGVAALLDGEGGDELFQPSSYVFADLLMRGRLVSAIRLAERLPGVQAHSRRRVLQRLSREWVLKGATPHAAHSLLRRLRPRHYGARWLTEDAAIRHGRSSDPWAWKRLDGPRWWAHLAFELTEGRAQFGGHDFLRHKSALAGLEGRHPYLQDVDLVSQMLAIPSEASYDETFDRPLLRRAVAGLVPDAVRLRTEKSYFDALFEHVVTSTDRDALLELLDQRAHVGRYVRVDMLRSWILGTSARPRNWCWVVWRAATAECWLRQLEDRTFAERIGRDSHLAPAQLELRGANAYELPA